MKTLPNKDPDEVKDYGLDWIPALGPDTITSSAWITVSAAGMTVDSDSHTANSTVLWLSGGTDGQTGVFTNRVETAGGRTLEETIAVAVVSSVAQSIPVPTDPRAPVTVAEFKRIKPDFAGVDDATIQYYLDMAGTTVGAGWPDKLYRFGIIALTCHLMTLSGLGTSQEASNANSGGMVRLKSASVDVQVSQVAADAVARGGYDATACGREFLRLMSQVHAGPITVGGGGLCVSPYAKDWPRYAWQGYW